MAKKLKQDAVDEISEVAVSEEDLDTLASDLAALHRSTTLEFALAAGRMVVDRLYGGSLDRWRNGAGAKDGTLRSLAAKLEARRIRGLSAAALQQAVATLDLDERVGVSGRPQLTASHVRAVIGLPDDRQEQLLGTAEAKDWTAERLSKEVEKTRSSLPVRPGRPPLLGFVRTVNRWERELADEDGSFADLDRAAALPPDEAVRVRAAVVAMRDRCDALLSALP